MSANPIGQSPSYADKVRQAAIEGKDQLFKEANPQGNLTNQESEVKYHQSATFPNIDSSVEKLTNEGEDFIFTEELPDTLDTKKGWM